jgi:pSer/pThr/pTyr-binding forkhead associated (FHA) protein
MRVQPHPAMDGTLQFLPGRFEIIEGLDTGQEVRFVKTPGPDGTSVTFGRSDGPSYRHVTLNAATVSRQHARIVQDGREWRLYNLSKTNPVVLNGRPMADEGDSAMLNDGDRVEMGEIVFRYHSR